MWGRASATPSGNASGAERAPVLGFGVKTTRDETAVKGPHWLPHLADAINLHCLRPMPANVRSGH
jgi:hypothetical protein